MNEDYVPIPVAGYKPQSQATIDLVNTNKRKEEEILVALDHLATLDFVDKRWLAIGRTSVEQAFMAINRSIFKPNRTSL